VITGSCPDNSGKEAWERKLYWHVNRKKANNGFEKEMKGGSKKTNEKQE
jgi:hypothetical protein